jgi:DNA-binding FadR family transcriptional regulator
VLYVLAVANREIAMTPLQPRVLAAVKANAEGILFRHLCIAIPDVSIRQMQQALSQLRNDGKIELVDGRFHLRVKKATPPPGYNRSEFIAPSSRERLMAGR